jgi:hypothetical protein
MKPVTPKELKGTAGDDIPEVVIEAVNNLLKKKFRKNQSVTLRQDDIAKEISRLNSDMTPTKVYANGWMDFEPVFERAGWTVTYDKPGYYESYPATFEFTPKK